MVVALVKIGLLLTAVSILAVPVALLAIVPALALDRTIGIATGVLAAIAISLLVPFDVGVAIVLLAQVGVAGLFAAERPKHRGRAVAIAGGIATASTALVYPLLRYLASGVLPTAELADPWRSAWVAATLGPALATVLALPLLPLYQRLVGEITRGTIYHLENRAHPLLRQIAERSPGTWQHSLAMASMAENAADQIGADAQLVRVGAYFHDLGKSLQPKYFIENIEPGETWGHDQLPPDVSCAAIFEHVTEGIATARRSGLHERVVDFMHMHHGDGVLEYFWAKCRDGGNPNALTIDNFRYPGHPPQSRETAILAICDAVEAASRTLKSADPFAIDALVQRIVYGKLHLGQLDESGLAMAELRRIVDSLRDTIRGAHHGREASWPSTTTSGRVALVADTSVRLDSLDGPGGSYPGVGMAGVGTDSSQPTPALRPSAGSERRSKASSSSVPGSADAYGETAPTPAPPITSEPAKRISNEELGVLETGQVAAPAVATAAPGAVFRAIGPAAIGGGGTLIGTQTTPPPSTAPTGPAAAAAAPVDEPRAASSSQPPKPRTSPSKPPPGPSTPAMLPTSGARHQGRRSIDAARHAGADAAVGRAVAPAGGGRLPCPARDRAAAARRAPRPATLPPPKEARPRPGAVVGVGDARNRGDSRSEPAVEHDRSPTVLPIVSATAVRTSSTVPPDALPSGLPSLPPGAIAAPPAVPNINATVVGMVMPRKLRAELVEEPADDDASRTNPSLVPVAEAQVVDETPAPSRTSDLERTNPRLISNT